MGVILEVVSVPRKWLKFHDIGKIFDWRNAMQCGKLHCRKRNEYDVQCIALTAIVLQVAYRKRRWICILIGAVGKFLKLAPKTGWHSVFIADGRAKWIVDLRHWWRPYFPTPWNCHIGIRCLVTGSTCVTLKWTYNDLFIVERNSVHINDYIESSK